MTILYHSSFDLIEFFDDVFAKLQNCKTAKSPYYVDIVRCLTKYVLKHVLLFKIQQVELQIATILNILKALNNESSNE